MPETVCPCCINKAITELVLLSVEVRGYPWGDRWEHELRGSGRLVLEAWLTCCLSGCKSLSIFELVSPSLNGMLCVSELWEDQKENTGNFTKQCVYQEHILKNNECLCVLLGGIKQQQQQTSVSSSTIFLPSFWKGKGKIFLKLLILVH